MTELFQQKLFAKLVNNSGTAEAAFLVNRTIPFSFSEASHLYSCFFSYSTFHLCSFTMAVAQITSYLMSNFTI